jgi:hypothetical protein
MLDSLSGKNKRIDVWWWRDYSSRLMLLLAYIITRSKVWENSTIRLLATVDEKEADETVHDIFTMLNEIRINAEPEMIAKPSSDAVAAYSADADLVFLPFRWKKDHPVDPFGNPLDDILQRLPMTVFVKAAEKIDMDAEPEDEPAVEISSPEPEHKKDGGE